MKKTKGITLIALIITIIILLILAGVAISTLTGSGLFEKAKLAKEKHENAQEEENLILQEYENSIGNLGSISSNREENISNLINNFNIKVEDISGATIKINIDGTIATTDGSNIVGYIIIVNGAARNVTENMPYSIKLEASTNYELDVIAIDKNADLKKSNGSKTARTQEMIETLLEYPILTKNGMVNTKYTNPADSNDYYYKLNLNKQCTAEDALDITAYDGNNSTYYDGTSTKCKFYFGKDIDIYQVCFKIDPTFDGTVFTREDGKGYIMTSEGEIINNGIFHTTYYGKGSSQWAGYYLKLSTKVYEVYYDSNIE